MAYLVFDFGTRHIGIAVAEPRAASATPLTTTRAKDGIPVWDEIDRVVAQWQPEGLVVGLPLNMDGTESDMSARARRFGSALRKRYGMKTVFADERLSTFEAGTRSEDRGRPDHAAAAVVIAETWMAEQP